MATLKIPLSLTEEGFLGTVDIKNDILQRIKIFVISGISKYILLPSKGIATLWQYLAMLGATSKLCMSGVIPEHERIELEKAILIEINEWFDNENIEFEKVQIVGNEEYPNGIQFYTSDIIYSFHFEFHIINENNKNSLLGNWSIIESYSNV